MCTAVRCVTCRSRSGTCPRQILASSCCGSVAPQAWLQCLAVSPLPTASGMAAGGPASQPAAMAERGLLSQSTSLWHRVHLGWSVLGAMGMRIGSEAREERPL